MVNKKLNPINKFVDKGYKDIPKGLEDIPKNRFESVEQYAKAFVDSMNNIQIDRFKKMLDSGIDAGKSVADVYGIDPDEFIKAVKEYVKHK